MTDDTAPSHPPAAGAGAAGHPVSWALSTLGVRLTGTLEVHADADGVLHVSAGCAERVGETTLVEVCPLAELYRFIGWCQCAVPLWGYCGEVIGVHHTVLTTFGPAFGALAQVRGPAQRVLVLAALAARLQGSAWPVAEALGEWAATHGMREAPAAIAELVMAAAAPPQWWWYLPDGPTVDVYSDHVHWRHHVLTLARLELESGPLPADASALRWVLVEGGPVDATVRALLWAHGQGSTEVQHADRGRHVLVCDAALATGLAAWQAAAVHHSAFHAGLVIELGAYREDDPPQLGEALAALAGIDPELALDVARAALA